MGMYLLTNTVTESTTGFPLPLFPLLPLGPTVPSTPGGPGRPNPGGPLSPLTPDDQRKNHQTESHEKMTTFVEGTRDNYFRYNTGRRDSMNI